MDWGFMPSIGDGNIHGNAIPMNGRFMLINGRFVQINSDSLQKTMGEVNGFSLGKRIR